jgi:hypothetical protein
MVAARQTRRSIAGSSVDIAIAWEATFKKRPRNMGVVGAGVAEKLP